MVASSSSFGSQPAVASAGNLASQAVACFCNNKMASLIVFAMIAGKIRIMTRSRIEYNYANWREEVTALLNSYNIFDAQSRATIMSFIDKYWAGAEVKLDDTTLRTKNDDGSVFTVKGKKLTQKPAGFMGLFDAYVLQQLQKVTAFVPGIAACYLLINNPCGTIGLEVTKQSISKV
jgi:hypothetical protein